QRQEIEKLKAELGQFNPDDIKVPVRPKAEPVTVKQEEPIKEVKQEEPIKEVNPPVEEKKPPVMPIPKVRKVETKKVASVQRNEVDYNNAKAVINMAIGMYIATNGEEYQGRKRMSSELIRSRFNKRKVNTSLITGEITEEGGFFYYNG